MKISFREFKKEDISDYVKILEENYADKIKQTIKEFDRDIEDVINRKYPSEFITVIVNNSITGFGCWFKINNETYKLTWINIIPDYQKKGIGKKLIEELEMRIRQRANKNYDILLETDKPEFYKKSGYSFAYENEKIFTMRKQFIKK